MGERPFKLLSSVRSHNKAFSDDPKTCSANSTIRATRTTRSVSMAESGSRRALRCFKVRGAMTTSEISVKVSPRFLSRSMAESGSPF